MLLCEMREIVEAYLGKKVKDVVLTISACINYPQRQSMRDAGAIAGLNVLRFINGSTAASIAHGFDMTKSIPRNVLVFDCGGGTLDVSLLVIDEGTFEVKATAGDSHSGGMDFDNRLLKHFVDELMLNYQQDLRSNNRAMVRLLGACEQAKRGLSASVEAYIDLDGLCEGVSFKSTIARTNYENLCSDLLAKLLHPVERVLRDAKRSKSMVDEVIAVGGLAHVLKVQQLLSDYFDGKILSKPIRPDNAAVTGVTAQTAILSNELPSNVSNVVLLDVIPLSLGVEIDGKSRQ